MMGKLKSGGSVEACASSILCGNVALGVRDWEDDDATAIVYLTLAEAKALAARLHEVIEKLETPT